MATRRAASRRKPKTPAPPKTLKPHAAKRWRDVYPILAARGRVDLETLALYCTVWGRWREAEDGIGTAGQLTKTGNRIVQSPLLDVAAKAMQQVTTLEQRLGLPIVTANDDGEDQGGGAELVTRQVLAARLRKHHITIAKLELDGLPVARRGKGRRPSLYSEPEVRAWLEAREQTAQKTGVADVSIERARKERAQAVLAEQTFQARSRELLPAAEVERVWNAEIQAVRAAILATYTTQADRVHRAAILDGVAGVEAELKAIATALLRELANPDRLESDGASHAA